MWFALAGCQEPFEVDRHDLAGFRIAAVEVRPLRDGSPFTPAAAVVVDGHPWAEEPAGLSWAWVADEDEAVHGSPEWIAAGAAPALVVPADGRRVLVLEASHGAEVRRAFARVPIGDVVGAQPVFAVGRVDLPAAPEGPELLPEARARRAVEPGRTVDPRGWLRLDVGASDPGDLARFMATAGSFLELDPHTADWVAADGFVLDEDEVDDPGTPSAPGVVTALGLIVGGRGSRWRATEVFVGEAPEGLWIGQRFVPGDGVAGASPDQPLRVTLRRDPASPCGLRVTDPVAVADVGDGGTRGLACDPPVVGPFDPDWLFTQRCGVPALDGAEVVVVPAEAP